MITKILSVRLLIDNQFLFVKLSGQPFKKDSVTIQGIRQVVRHRPLKPTFGGSNPSSPAKRYSFRAYDPLPYGGEICRIGIFFSGFALMALDSVLDSVTLGQGTSEKTFKVVL